MNIPMQLYIGGHSFCNLLTAKQIRKEYWRLLDSSQQQKSPFFFIKMKKEIKNRKSQEDKKKNIFFLAKPLCICLSIYYLSIFWYFSRTFVLLEKSVLWKEFPNLVSFQDVLNPLCCSCPFEGQTSNVLRCKLSHQTLISISHCDNTLFSSP